LQSARDDLSSPDLPRTKRGQSCGSFIFEPLKRLPGTVTGAARRLTFLGEGLDQRPPALGVDVEPAGDVASHAVEEPLPRLGERTGRSSEGRRVLPRTGSRPAVRTLVDARHDLSSDAPTVLLRSQ